MGVSILSKDKYVMKNLNSDEVQVEPPNVEDDEKPSGSAYPILFIGTVIWFAVLYGMFNVPAIRGNTALLPAATGYLLMWWPSFFWLLVLQIRHSRAVKAK